MIARVVEPEILDSLPANDPRAVHSRRDLRVINRFMGNGGHLARRITSLKPAPQTIVELGAGDGTLLLELARRLPGPVKLYLLDMQPVVSKETLERYRSFGWETAVLPVRLQDWNRHPNPPSCDLMIANLFLHHFSADELRNLFTVAAGVTRCFLSCDPRRWRPALYCTRLLWLLGCNKVTLNDARASVQAGFRDQELSKLWPTGRGFNLEEVPVGFSSHLFMATGQEPTGSPRPLLSAASAGLAPR